jgi:hypothetical protein
MTTPRTEYLVCRTPAEVRTRLDALLGRRRQALKGAPTSAQSADSTQRVGNATARLHRPEPLDAPSAPAAQARGHTDQPAAPTRQPSAQATRARPSTAHEGHPFRDPRPGAAAIFNRRPPPAGLSTGAKPVDQPEPVLHPQVSRPPGEIRPSINSSETKQSGPSRQPRQDPTRATQADQQTDQHPPPSHPPQAAPTATQRSPSPVGQMRPQGESRVSGSRPRIASGPPVRGGACNLPRLELPRSSSRQSINSSETKQSGPSRQPRQSATNTTQRAHQTDQHPPPSHPPQAASTATQRSPSPVGQMRPQGESRVSGSRPRCARPTGEGRSVQPGGHPPKA